MRWIGLALTIWVSFGCSGDDDLSLIVELRTDYVAGVEFAAVRTDLEDRGASDEAAALRGESFLDRRRIAAFNELPPGTRSIRVRLLDRDMRVIATRRVLRQQDSNASVLVVVGRVCGGIDCPAAGDALERTECRAGVCVLPTCDDETGERCESACLEASDCTEASACATPSCETGACLYEGDDTACAAGEYCDPTRGCRPESEPPLDAAMDTSIADASVDAPDADAGVATTSMLVVGHYRRPYLTVYSTGDWSTVDVSTLPAGAGNAAAFSPDGSTFAVAHERSPFVTIYDTSDWSKLADPAALPTSSGYAVAFSPDGSMLAVGTLNAPYLVIYSTSDWSRIADPATPPTGAGNAVAFSPDGMTLAVSHSRSPYVSIYDTSDWSKIADPATLPTNDSNCAAFSPDGSLLAVGSFSSPFLTLYDTSDWSQVAAPSVLPMGSNRGCPFSPDGSMLAVAHVNSPFVTIYDTSDWSKISDPPSLPTNSGYSAAFCR